MQSRCGVSGRIFASHRRRRWRSVVVETRLIASLLGFHAFTGRQAIPRPWFFLTFSFVQPKEKANKKKGCRLRIRCYSGGTPGYSAHKLAATRGSSDRCLTSRRPHRLRFTPRMLMSGDPDGRQAIVTSPVRLVRTGRRVTVRLVAAACRHVETRLIASLLGFHAFTGRQAIPRPKRSGVKRTTQRGRRGAAHCLSRRERRVCAAQPEQGGSSR